MRRTGLALVYKGKTILRCNNSPFGRRPIVKSECAVGFRFILSHSHQFIIGMDDGCAKIHHHATHTKPRMNLGCFLAGELIVLRPFNVFFGCVMSLSACCVAGQTAQAVSKLGRKGLSQNQRAQMTGYM